MFSIKITKQTKNSDRKSFLSFFKLYNFNKTKKNKNKYGIIKIKPNL